MDLKEVECGGKDWSGLPQDNYMWLALVNEGINLRVP
jgi:hypothetical protein